ASGRLVGEAADCVQAALAKYQRLEQSVERFVASYHHYCWPVESLNDLKLAPFHLLATEGKVHTDRNHVWHMETLADICQHDAGVLLATNCKLVNVTDAANEAEAIAWWTGLTSQGGEGIVVKPLDFIVKGKKGLLQPAVKCRGPEYL